MTHIYPSKRQQSPQSLTPTDISLILPTGGSDEAGVSTAGKRVHFRIYQPSSKDVTICTFRSKMSLVSVFLEATFWADP